MILKFRAVAFAVVFALSATALISSPALALQSSLVLPTISDLGQRHTLLPSLSLPALDRNAALAAASPPLPVTAIAIPDPQTLDALVANHAAEDSRDAEQECLANAVYFEARGESLQGQLAVAEVVMNRAASGRYPASLCGVVVQRSQFSFVRRGRMPRADRASDAWRRAVGVARVAVDRMAPRLLPATCLWYHANYVSPGWGRRLARSARIGLHIFYS